MFLWDVSTGQKIRRFRGHDSAVNAVSFAADDQVVITAGYDRAMKMWDCRSNSIDPIQSVVAWRDAVTSLTVAGHRITGGSVDGTLRTLDVRAGRVHVDDLGHPVLCVRRSRDDNCLLTGMLGRGGRPPSTPSLSFSTPKTFFLSFFLFKSTLSKYALSE